MFHELMAYCLELPGAWQDEPWEGTIVAKMDQKILGHWIDRTAAGLAHAAIAACAVIDFEVVKIDGWLPQQILSRLIAKTRDCLHQGNLDGIEVSGIKTVSEAAETLF